jgi:hypothetical protein
MKPLYRGVCRNCICVCLTLYLSTSFECFSYTMLSDIFITSLFPCLCPLVVPYSRVRYINVQLYNFLYLTLLSLDIVVFMTNLRTLTVLIGDCLILIKPSSFEPLENIQKSLISILKECWENNFHTFFRHNRGVEIFAYRHKASSLKVTILRDVKWQFILNQSGYSFVKLHVTDLNEVSQIRSKLQCYHY